MSKFQCVDDNESDLKNKASIQLFSQFELHNGKNALCSIMGKITLL